MDEKKRSRKKQLYQDILKQVEFYFSAANLSKDRFMTQVLADNEHGIELTVLMTFNKLKALTTDINILKKALQLSQVLELTENEARVKSKVPYVPKPVVDECTIYVERLPLDANIDFMRQIFTSFGPVDYVSLPKFQNDKIKGFGFVEFATPAGAQKAIEEFKKSGSYLPIDMEPGNLRSVCTFDKKTKDKFLKSKVKNFDDDEHINRSREDEDMTAVTEEIDNVEIEPANTDDDNDKKRKHKTSPSTLERKKKKVKSEKADEEGSDEIYSHDKSVSDGDKSADLDLHDMTTRPSESNRDTSDDKLPEEKDSSDLPTADEMKPEHCEVDMERSEHDDGNPEDSSLQKVKKKRRQKKKAKKERPTVNSGLMILSKSDWKKLRNKYLTVQWEKMKTLKKHLYKCKQYGDYHGDSHHSSTNNGHSQDTVVDTPNSVVKISFDQSVTNIKEFKAQVKSLSDQVKNIDVKEGSTEAHVRFSSEEYACAFVNNKSDWTCLIIRGDEELKYWMKITEDRLLKLGKKNKKIEHMEEDIQNNDDPPIDNKSISKGLKEKPILSVLPGTIVKIQCLEPIVNIKQFKDDIRGSSKDVVYVDVKEGCTEAFIRLDTPDNAEAFSSLNSFGHSQILSGDKEQDYWNKINEDRTNKFNKNVRINKRGKDKIIKKAENILGRHIIFDDADDSLPN